jgi:acyl-coenzyme A synthetase/AMP-(fatty) acid ligase
VLANANHLPMAIPLHDELTLTSGRTFQLHGRKADMINIAGKRASLADLNIKLNEIVGVVDGVLIMPYSEKLDCAGIERLMAFVVLEGIDDKTLLQELKKKIDPAFLPRPVHQLKKLPREITGKLSKKKLSDLVEKTKKMQ